MARRAAAGRVCEPPVLLLARQSRLSINRVAARVRSGGHHVSDDTIRRRYARSVQNFLELYRPIVTTWQVYDNSNGRPRLIAFDNGYFDTVLDPDRWDLFNRSATDGGPNDPAGS